MPEYLTPGVYYQATDVSRRGITAIRTDIAAFVGLAERGPLHEPWRVSSWRQFQTMFGDLMAQGYLAYCVKAFFENGGRTCYVVRVAHEDAVSATGELPGRDGLPTLRISASSPGRWGNRLQLRLNGSRADMTQTAGAQDPSGENSTVASIIGFPAGALVRLTQAAPGGVVDVYRVVAAVDAAGRVIRWAAALPVQPGDPSGFDLAQPIDLETEAFTLAVFERGRLKSLYEDLSIVPGSARYAPDVINLNDIQRQRQDRPLPLIEVTDLHAGMVPASWGDWLPDIGGSTPAFSQGLLTLQCGTDGLATLTAADFTGDLSAVERAGLRALELVEEVSLVAIPDILIQPTPPILFAPLPAPEPDPCLDGPTPPGPLPIPPGPCPDIVEQPPLFSEYEISLVQQALIVHCESMADRVALLDPPLDGQVGVEDIGRALGWRQRFDSSFAALYYPWVLMPDPLRLNGEVVRPIPPSGHVAGVIARTDLTRGVHHAPANAVLAATEGFTVAVSEEWQALLNPAGVNCLRALPGRELRVYGARTLSSDAALRYLSVRRTLLMIEKALLLSLQWAVFEPHDFYLRQSVALAIGGFLAALWRNGALVGNTPEEAFFVRCDDENNPPAAVDNGQLVIDVGVALVRPAEFVIVRVGRTQDELELTELNRVEA